MKLYIYHIAPIDFWFGAITPGELIAQINRESLPTREASRQLAEVSKLEELAQANFKEVGWEGDITEGPYFFALPGDNSMRLGYVLKQSNNGNCFIASPTPLPAGDLSIFDEKVTDLV